MHQYPIQRTPPSSRIAVIIPALNEARSIANVLGDIPDWVDDIIVADNGSSDDTVAIAEANGARVVHEPRRGYGAACLRGIAALANPDIVVFLDGDYSDHPEQMESLIAPILNDEADMVIGSRALGNAEPGALTPQARYGNRLACLLMRWFWGVRYTDLGPFRAIRYSSLQSLQMVDTNYGWTVEMQIKAALHKLRTTEVPVDYRKRIGESKVSGTVRGVIGASYKILTTIFFSAIRYHIIEKKRSALRRKLIIFTRYPEPGSTKTRLIPALGPEGAADLQQKMTEHAVHTASTLNNIQIEICYTGATTEAMTDWLGDHLAYEVQHPGDLGDRMQHALYAAFEQGFDHAVIIGIDCPAITSTILETAFDALATCNVVIGPATDGGYYLVGATRDTKGESLNDIFSDMEWGSAAVFPTTRQRLEDQKTSWHRLAWLNDLDRPEDLREWDRVQPDAMRPELSIIIPTLNESDNLKNTLPQITRIESIEVIVVDGGSTDDTIEVATSLGATVIQSPKGRAMQMNYGAAHASGRMLVFLHADTRLPDSFPGDIAETLVRPGTACGAFRLGIDQASRTIRTIIYFANLRARFLQLPYGDQAIFMTRDAFHRVSGYPDLPIMEDFTLIRNMRQFGKIRLANSSAMTHARRWKDHGPWRTVLRNQAIILIWYFGFPLNRIAKKYNLDRESKANDSVNS